MKKSNLFSNLKLNSWEIEILIVGFLLISLLQIPTYIMDIVTDYTLKLDRYSDHLMFKNVSLIIVLRSLRIATNMIIINLSIYILLRSFWVGLLGLSYVFPSGINIKKLKYNKYMIENLKEYDLEKSIFQLDKLCSSIFSFAFLIILTSLSMVIILIESLLFASLFASLDQDEFIMDIVAFTMLTLGGIYIFDQVTFGLIKKIKWKPIAFIYSYIYKIFNYISLGFIYNTLYYTYISNIKYRFMVMAIFILFIIFYFQDYDNRFDFQMVGSSKYISTYKYYKNEINNLGKGHRPAPFIQSKIIKDNYLDLHIPYSASINNGLDNLCTDINNIEKIGDLDSIKYFLPKVIKCVNAFFSISIDSLKVNSNFISNYYADKYSKYYTFNMVVPLLDINNGDHILRISSADTSITKLPKNINYTIPFYLDR